MCVSSVYCSLVTLNSGTNIKHLNRGWGKKTHACYTKPVWASMTHLAPKKNLKETWHLLSM